MKHERIPLYDALNAAANGLSVIPADPRTGEPLIDISKASTDPEVIRAWWDQYPAAQPAGMAPKPKELKATPYVWRDPASIPRREFLYGQHLIRKFASAKFAAGGVGKSILALTEATAMATGRSLLGITPPKNGDREVASRFWVGGTGTWDASDTTHWAATSGGAGGQSVPGSSDSVTGHLAAELSQSTRP